VQRGAHRRGSGAGRSLDPGAGHTSHVCMTRRHPHFGVRGKPQFARLWRIGSLLGGALRVRLCASA
jgi:hypothetical protein